MSIRSSIPDTVLANRYQVLHPLGRGGMGALYLARDLRFARRCVALKENVDRSPAAQAQFRLEAEVLATLHHPHLPAVTDHFVTPDGRQFLVMDYVEGENLEERVMRRGPLPEAQALAWAGQVLGALAYLHTQSPPVIHRDVKPANIRITPEGRAVLVDFGVAKHLVAGQPTATVARAGSPGYAPIEQYAGGTDQRSDIYSLGATLYFALTGQMPPEAPLLAAGQTLPNPRQLNPAISPRTEATILRAMRSDAGRRFQSAAEMRAALRGGPVQPSTPGEWLDGIRRMTRQQKIVLLAGSMLAMATFCALAALGWRIRAQSLETPTPTSVLIATLETVPAIDTLAPETNMPQPTDTATPGTATDSLVATSTPRSTVTATPTHTPVPDRDKDDVPDPSDDCPDEPGLPALGGCPDGDGDGVRDDEDKCPDKPGRTEWQGCPDSDGDGIPDHQDQCPGQSGPADNGGCPKDEGNEGEGDGGGGEDKGKKPPPPPPSP